MRGGGDGAPQERTERRGDFSAWGQPPRVNNVTCEPCGGTTVQREYRGKTMVDKAGHAKENPNTDEKRSCGKSHKSPKSERTEKMVCKEGDENRKRCFANDITKPMTAQSQRRKNGWDGGGSGGYCRKKI